MNNYINYNFENIPLIIWLPIPKLYRFHTVSNPSFEPDAEKNYCGKPKKTHIDQ